MFFYKNKRIVTEISKFTIVGGANFFLTLMIFTVSLKYLNIDYLVSLALAWLFGMFFSYVFNFLWVFKPETKITFRSRLIKFIVSGLVSLLINMMALKVLVTISELDPFIAQFLLMPFIVIFNFCTAKFWSLRQNVKQP